MEKGNAIEVHALCKSFKVYMDKGNTLKERILFKSRRAHEVRSVLDGISFEVGKGEAVGLIGHNGCGKSTTLKLLSRIMYPDSGKIKIKGRVSSLIELGAGFHPDMSGRENIYINASIFGLTKKEIDQRLDDIIAFSELEEFIDNPVRTYSSGMYMRLAFSVAINVDADILLVDEILAVGDANFQSKCYNRMREIKSSGVTIVIVTHDTGVVERFCDRAIWINDGRIEYSGKSVNAVDHYLKFMNEEKLSQLEREEKRRRIQAKDAEKRRKQEEKERQQREKVEQERRSKMTKEELAQEEAEDISNPHFGTREAVLRKVEILDSNGEETRLLRGGEEYTIRYEYEVENTEKEYVFGMGIYNLDYQWIFGTNTQIGKVNVPKKQKGEVCFHGGKMELLTGEYILQVAITDVDGTPVDFYRNFCKFTVVSDRKDAGMIYMDHTWEV